MRFVDTAIPGAFVIDLYCQVDQRGFFARTFCAETFAARGLRPDLVQCSLSHNVKRGTLRGLHWQGGPAAEAKLVRCIQGAVFDVIVDLRPASAAYGRWEAFELTAANRRSLYVPEGVAHGFQTLEDNSDLLYQMSTTYAVEWSYGIRWDDPDLAIAWPDPDPVVSDRDARLPALDAVLEAVPC